MMLGMQQPGTLVISLDFELYWGMIDKVTLDAYGENIRGVHTAVPALLELFSRYKLHVTWATVGMVMAESLEELTTWLPPDEPRYADPRASTYEHIRSGAVSERLYYFAPDLVARSAATPGQEIGSHTFSHLYTLDMAPDVAALRADVRAAAVAAARHGLTLRSLVFPRNQISTEYLSLAAEAGYTAFRGTEDHFLYRPRREAAQTNLFLRALRLVDQYVNLSGHHTFRPQREAGLVNVPASRFLRPYSPRLRVLESMRLRRITRAMTAAATRGEVFHLWWHPHNFGANLDENLAFLTQIAEHFKTLRAHYGMESKTMSEVAEQYATV